tara:strand:+ start:304 stop:786 length:483 start_codon:yes stop_codon:yes gene_type:complete
MIIKERNDLQQLIHILQQQFPNEKNVPIKDSLDKMLDLNGQLNMLVDFGMLDGRVFLNFIKIMLVMQGLLESHSGIGEQTVSDAYDMVMDDGNILAQVGEMSRNGHDPSELLERLATDLKPASIKDIVGKTFDLGTVSKKELIGMMAAQEAGLKGGPADD